MTPLSKNKENAELTYQSIKVIAESVKIENLPVQTAQILGQNTTYLLKQITQDAFKFTRRSKRKHLTCTDVDQALKLRNIEPVYGHISPDSNPFISASTRDGNLYFTKEKTVDLTNIINSELPKAPLDIKLRSHWLSINGIQPAIPENPPPITKQEQKIISINPPAKINKQENKILEIVQVKQLAVHELSREEQIFYQQIVEACVGFNDTKRNEALQSLASDPGLGIMLSRFSNFISEGIKVNVVQNNLATLCYLSRMIKSLLDNETLYLEPYLHDIIPAVITCIVSKSVCLRPDVDNHWALRDFASRLIAQICKKFHTNTNNIQIRITIVFSKALQKDKLPLETLYGAIVGLSELGIEVIKLFLLPRIKLIGEQIRICDNSPVKTSAQTVAVQKIKQLFVKILVPVIATLRKPPDNVEAYTNDYGYFGVLLHAAVVKIKPQQTVVLADKLNLKNLAVEGAETNQKYYVINSTPGTNVGTQGTSILKTNSVLSSPSLTETIVIQTNK